MSDEPFSDKDQHVHEQPGGRGRHPRCNEYARSGAQRVPDYYEARETRFWVDEHGQKWRSMGNACWFTNLDIARRHEEMILTLEA